MSKQQQQGKTVTNSSGQANTNFSRPLPARDYSPLTPAERERLRHEWNDHVMNDERITNGSEGANVRAEMRQILKEDDEAEAKAKAQDGST